MIVTHPVMSNARRKASSKKASSKKASQQPATKKATSKKKASKKKASKKTAAKKKAAPRIFIRTKPKAVVNTSAIGKGVFAGRYLYDDTEVGEIEGELTKNPDVDPRYCMEMDPGWFLIPQETFRYVNHSCDPNCELFMWEDEDKDKDLGTRRLYLGTLRDIREGEELTIDYAWPAYLAIPCHCGSRECRGYVVDADELEFVDEEEAQTNVDD